MIARINGNGQGQVMPNDECSLRRQVFCLLGKSKTSVEQDLTVLTQCASHIRNTMRIEKAARACKLKLSGFLVSDVLELYYDLKRGREEMGYISKGWEEPGFRIGDLIAVPKSKSRRLKACLPQIRKFCATNGIAMTVKKTKESIEIQMDGVIYSEGFNKKTFLNTLDTLHECVERTEELIG
jgi:hypothetical protein